MHSLAIDRDSQAAMHVRRQPRRSVAVLCCWIHVLLDELSSAPQYSGARVEWHPASKRPGAERRAPAPGSCAVCVGSVNWLWER